MQTTVYLLRHAEYESPEHSIPGRLPGFPLSAAGREKAGELAVYFQKKPIVAVYASPLLRTRQTGEIIAKATGIPCSPDDRLLEVRSGIGGQKEGFIENELGGWLYTSKWHKDRRGEMPQEIFDRMADFMRKKVAQHAGEELIVVSHGDPIMFLIAGYQGLPFHSREVQKLDYIQMGQYITLLFDSLTAPPHLIR